MDEKPVFSIERANEGISAACEAFDSLDLTLTERWWAAKSVEIAARKILGDKFAELAEQWEASQSAE